MRRRTAPSPLGVSNVMRPYTGRVTLSAAMPARSFSVCTTRGTCGAAIRNRSLSNPSTRRRTTNPPSAAGSRITSDARSAKAVDSTRSVISGLAAGAPAAVPGAAPEASVRASIAVVNLTTGAGVGAAAGGGWKALKSVGEPYAAPYTTACAAMISTGLAGRSRIRCFAAKASSRSSAAFLGFDVAMSSVLSWMPRGTTRCSTAAL